MNETRSLIRFLYFFVFNISTWSKNEGIYNIRSLSFIYGFIFLFGFFLYRPSSDTYFNFSRYIISYCNIFSLI